MKTMQVVSIVLAALVLAGLGFVYSGLFNVAADDPHWGLTQRLLESARERSVAARADDIEAPPELDDAKLIAMGAEHYSEMCTGCHLAPGVRATEIRTGLYPKPPNLVERGLPRSPEQTFWIIKHGLKMTGMPAWGLTHDDRSIWGLVAFLRKLPELSADAYHELVEEGGGHSHAHAGGEQGESGKENGEHSHGAEAGGTAPQAGHQHREAEPAKGEGAKPHEHAAGSEEGGHAHPAERGAALPPSTVEPVAIVDGFFRSLASGDTRSASAVLDPAVLIFESGGAERSRQEYASHHLGADASFLKSAKHQLLSRTGDAIGDLAWVASEMRLSSQGAKPVNLVSTETMVLRKTSSGWRIVHIHWSNRKAGA